MEYTQIIISALSGGVIARLVGTFFFTKKEKADANATLIANMQDHMLYLNKQFGTLLEKHEEKSKEYEKLQDEYVDLLQKYSTLKKEFEAFKKKYAAA